MAFDVNYRGVVAACEGRSIRAYELADEWTKVQRKINAEVPDERFREALARAMQELAKKGLLFEACVDDGPPTYSATLAQVGLAEQYFSPDIGIRATDGVLVLA